MQVFLSYAFRPFFLLNALFAVAAMTLWGFALHGAGPDFLPANIVYWHAHEMIVGFGMATVAGFVLTAVATWTGRPPVRGFALALLVLAWLTGRIALLLSGSLPGSWVFGADMLFPLLLVLLLAREVIAAGNRRNFPIVYITLLLAALNALYHLSVNGYVPMFMNAERVALYLLVHALLLLITVIGGRIIPNFTANWLSARGATAKPVTSQGLDRATIAATLATGLFASIVPVSSVTGILALLAAALHGWRLSRWCGLSTRAEPLLFVLHVAYLWLPVGYLLTALASFGWWVPPSAALHALTVGAIGMMIMGVTTRVALAHTGRPLQASRLLVVGYAAVAVAAIVRVVSPFGGWYLTLLDVSIAAWVAAFGIFLVVYAPVLLAPRVDGQA